MRLLDTETLELHEFFDEDIPEYAILSHRWEAGEVSFQDVTQRRNRQAPGWSKIRKFCRFARENQFNWAWVDTCGIDKTSSAELSEAINSMYKWYENSTTCFVYFCDVVCEAQDVLQLEQVRDQRRWTEAGNPLGDMGCSESTASALLQSQWFTRGWTLQELLAPDEAVFLDRYWRIFGSRGTLNGLVSSITGIADANNVTIYVSSIATRMSWASNRRCTRSEDTAYSLMGMFRVNMPLLYGEGSGNAFKRLQLEILKTSDDESIFAWHADSSRRRSESMLADSPSAFARSSNIRPFEPIVRRKPYAMTNKGLEITTVILTSKVDPSLHYLPLNCYRGTSSSPLAVILHKTANGTYKRCHFTKGSTDTLELPRESDLEIRGFKGPSIVYVVDMQDNPNLAYTITNTDLDRLRSTMDRYLSLGNSNEKSDSAAA